MYSDWPQFESFCERIELATETQRDLASLLHEFRCYVETRLGQVRMRAVLTNQCNLQPEVARFQIHAPLTSQQLPVSQTNPLQAHGIICDSCVALSLREFNVS